MTTTTDTHAYERAQLSNALMALGDAAETFQARALALGRHTKAERIADLVAQLDATRRGLYDGTVTIPTAWAILDGGRTSAALHHATISRIERDQRGQGDW